MNDLNPLPHRIAWFAPWTWKRRWLVLAVVTLLVAYPLSYGPMWGLRFRGWISPTVLEVSYAPIIWLAKHNDTIRKWVVWYILFFRRGA